MTQTYEIEVVPNTAITTKKQQEYLSTFQKEYRGIGTSIMKTAKAYADSVRADPSMRQIFKDTYPSIKPVFWNKLEKISNDTMDPRLFDYTGAHAERLISMPKADQKTLIDKGVEVAEEQSDGTIDFRKLRLKDMTPEQVKRVVSSDGPKSAATQRTELQTSITRRNTKANAKEIAKSSVVQKAVNTEPYTEGIKSVQFHGSCRMSWTKLRNMVEKHDKKASSK